MKAIHVHEFGGPEVLRQEEVSTPRPGPGEVLVRMQAAGVNPVETYIRAGKYARLPELPYTPGNDGAGVVEQVGSDVSEFKAGDHVYTSGSISGTYAEFALCKKEQVHPLPANVSFAQGAAMGTPYATAYRGLLQRAEAKPGETVLVHGASGGVGTAAVQLARARGLRVFGTAGSDDGINLTRQQGAHERESREGSDHSRKRRARRDHREPRPGGDRSAQYNAARRRCARDDLAEHAPGRAGKHSRRARGRSGKRDVASGDWQRISAVRRSQGASSGDGTRSAGEDCACSEQVKIKKEELRN
jgi:D-arabinose 1-dehydrogenase-like Zn-dependent alcohol dehydrogenase